MFVYHTCLVGRNLVSWRGPHLRERFRQFSERAAVALNRFRKAANRLDGSLFSRGYFLPGPFLRKLRNVDQNQSEREKPPPCALLHEPELAANPVRGGDGNERQIFVHSRLAEMKFSALRRSLAMKNGAFLIVR